MIVRTIPLLLLLSVVLFSCQKEIDWGINLGGGGNANGDLLVKALEITPSTNDTNTITFQWDANKRLLEYKSSGKVAGIVTEIEYKITRLPDGKIRKIYFNNNLTAGFVDSIVYSVYYDAGGTRLAYSVGTTYSLIGEIKDSTIYTYNAAGLISEKIGYADFLGSYEPGSRNTLLYDPNGNLVRDSSFSPDGAGGWDFDAVAVHTYDGHKNAVVLGEESYIVLGEENISKNNLVQSVTTESTGGTVTTITVTQQQFNSFDRPTQGNMSVTPQPPGYDLKLLYFYQ